MYYKIFTVCILYYYHIFLFTDKFYFLNDKQDFYSCIFPLNNIFLANYIFALEKIMKNIPRTIFILMSANKNVFLKN